MDDLARQKIELRRLHRAHRLGLREQSPDAPRRAADRLDLHRLPPFAVFSGYMPMGSEFDPWPIIERLRATGAPLCLPWSADRESPLLFRRFDSRAGLIADSAGIPSPPPSSPEMDPDLVLCPLLAFDRQGHRLGQGAGHYDRTLIALRARKPVFVLGVGYAAQEVASLPVGPHDAPLDAIATENEYIAVG